MTYPRKKNNGGAPVFARGKVIGRVRGDTFYKTVKGSRHMLRKPRAWAFDVSTLRDAEEAGAVRVEILDSDTGRRYRTTIKTIWQHDKRFDRGHGRQIYLALEHWTDPDAAKQPTLFSLKEEGVAA